MFYKPIYTYIYRSVKEEVKQILLNEEIMTYHCTKLTMREIEYLDKLEILNINNQIKRVRQAINEEFNISIDISDMNIESNQKIIRENKIWFVYDKRYAIKNNSGCENFF